MLIFQFEINEIPPSERHKLRPRSTKKQYYGRVAFYLRHTYEDASVMLAYINWAKIIPNHSISSIPVKRFVEEGAPQFYDVSCIKRVVGFFDIGRKNLL